MKRLLLIEPKYDDSQQNLKLLRVELSESYTKIDFGYQPAEKQKEVGKIIVPTDIYLSVKNEKKKFMLIRAENIPIAPKQHRFNTTTDFLFFSLYFEPMPFKTYEFAVSENERISINNLQHHLVKIAHNALKNISHFNFDSIMLDKKKQFGIK